MRGATKYWKPIHQKNLISTHTPHAGRDRFLRILFFHGVNFYSHAPCGARRCKKLFLVKSGKISTHTPHAGRDHRWLFHRRNTWISTHTPHAGRDCCLFHQPVFRKNFYSHAPCGARLQYTHYGFPCIRFLLTRPMRGATLPLSVWISESEISTHTPHAGRDKIEK